MAEAEAEYSSPAAEADMQYHDHAEDSQVSVIDSLSGQEKATALLVAMGKETAARLIKHFSSDELRKLSGKASNLPDIKMPDFEKLVQEFEEAFAEGASFSQAEQRFKLLVRENLPEDEADAVLDPSLADDQSQGDVFEAMTGMTAEELQPYLADEHPQVVAYIVSRLPDELAARVLLAQTPEDRVNIVQRTLALEPVHAAADAIISQALPNIFTRQSKGGQTSHYKQVAMVLNRLDTNDLDEVMSSLEGLNEEDLANIKARMFRFEDVPKLDDKSRRILLDNISAEDITMAMRGGDIFAKEIILSSLSQRTRRMIEADLEIEDSRVSRDDIARARRKIVDMALNLADLEKISLNTEETTA